MIGKNFIASLGVLFVICAPAQCEATAARMLSGKYGISQADAQQIVNAGRVNELGQAVAQGITGPEFVQGFNQRLTLPQMLQKKANPSLDRLKVLGIAAPTAQDFQAGNQLLALNPNFTQGEFDAAKALVNAPGGALPVNAANVEAAGKLIAARPHIAVDDDNVKAAKALITAGITVTAKSVANAHALLSVATGALGITEDNLKAANALRNAPGKAIDVTGDNVTQALAFMAFKPPILVTAENFEAAENLKAAGAPLTDSNVQAAKALKGVAKITVDNVAAAAALLATRGALKVDAVNVAKADAFLKSAPQIPVNAPSFAAADELHADGVPIDAASVALGVLINKAGYKADKINYDLAVALDKAGYPVDKDHFAIAVDVNALKVVKVEKGSMELGIDLKKAGLDINAGNFNSANTLKGSGAAVTKKNIGVIPLLITPQHGAAPLPKYSKDQIEAVASVPEGIPDARETVAWAIQKTKGTIPRGLAKPGKDLGAPAAVPSTDFKIVWSAPHAAYTASDRIFGPGGPGSAPAPGEGYIRIANASLGAFALNKFFVFSDLTTDPANAHSVKFVDGAQTP